ncbi:MAG: hypothetical protein ACKO4U_19065, partial [Caldilinea sp.]
RALLQALAGLGALFTAVDPAQLPDIELDLATLDALGVDTAPLAALGIERFSLIELASLLQQTLPTAPLTETIPLPLEKGLEELPDSLTLDPAQVDLAGAAEASLNTFATDLLRAINLNTLGYELDNTLSQFGLQLRQGDLYLNRLGAERLNASTGDLVELYIGPLPVRFRVRAVVNQAGPLSALTPVVMLRLDEAQQLLFMPDKVNSMLVSNQGDEMSGMQHTAAVSRRLRVLALDDNAVATVARILAEPAVRAALAPQIAALPAGGLGAIDTEEMPPFLATLMESLLSSFNIEQIGRLDLEELMAESDSGLDTPALRAHLARAAVRDWLLAAALPGDVRRDFANAVANLNQFTPAVLSTRASSAPAARASRRACTAQP